MIPTHLRIQSNQRRLTLEQEREARRFADERVEAQLSTAPVEASGEEALLKQVYQVARLPPPERIHWVDGPLHLVRR